MRGLTTTSFKSDEPKFEAMARASLDLCRTHVDLFKAAAAAAAATAVAADSLADGEKASVAAAPAKPAASGVRDLAAARMHLRGILKQCEASFSGHALFAEMKTLLDEVVCMEDEAVAAAKAALSA